jgi:hypothetical protein
METNKPPALLSRLSSPPLQDTDPMISLSPKVPLLKQISLSLQQWMSLPLQTQLEICSVEELRINCLVAYSNLTLSNDLTMSFPPSRRENSPEYEPSLSSSTLSRVTLQSLILLLTLPLSPTLPWSSPTLLPLSKWLTDLAELDRVEVPQMVCLPQLLRGKNSLTRRGHKLMTQTHRTLIQRLSPKGIQARNSLSSNMSFPGLPITSSPKRSSIPNLWKHKGFSTISHETLLQQNNFSPPASPSQSSQTLNGIMSFNAAPSTLTQSFC